MASATRLGTLRTMADAPVTAAPAAPPPHANATTVTVGSWVLYDLANTVYAATLTFVFTPFVIDAAGIVRYAHRYLNAGTGYQSTPDLLTILSQI